MYIISKIAYLIASFISAIAILIITFFTGIYEFLSDKSCKSLNDEHWFYSGNLNYFPKTSPMKIYLIGPFYPDPTAAINTFLNANNQLEAAGHTVVNIMYHAGWHEYPYKECVAYRLKLMLACDSVFVLPGWQHDPVAELEVIAAQSAGLSIYQASEAVIPSCMRVQIPFTQLLNS